MTESDDFTENFAALGRLIRPLALMTGAGILLYAAGIVWSGPEQTWRAATAVGWPSLLLGSAVSSFGYLLRFARWDLILRILGYIVGWRPGLMIYLCGLALTSTPGKLGETARSAFLLRHGVKVSDSLGAFLADRLSDVLGVALLGVLGAWCASRRLPPLELLAVAGLLGSLMVRRLVTTGYSHEATNSLQRRGRVRRWLASVSLPAASWSRVWIPSRVPLYVAASMGAYGLQAVVFAYYVGAVALALPIWWCVAIFSSATLLGAVSMVPAGLGVMEAALVVQLTAAGAAPEAALAAALLTRLSTLWVGVTIGSGALITLAFETRKAGDAILSRRD